MKPSISVIATARRSSVSPVVEEESEVELAIRRRCRSGQTELRRCLLSARFKLLWRCILIYPRRSCLTTPAVLETSFGEDEVRKKSPSSGFRMISSVHGKRIVSILTQTTRSAFPPFGILIPPSPHHLKDSPICTYAPYRVQNSLRNALRATLSTRKPRE